MEFQKMFNRIAKAIEICPNYSILYTWEEDGELISNITIPFSEKKMYPESKIYVHEGKIQIEMSYHKELIPAIKKFFTGYPTRGI